MHTVLPTQPYYYVYYIPKAKKKITTKITTFIQQTRKMDREKKENKQTMPKKTKTKNIYIPENHLTKVLASKTVLHSLEQINFCN